MFIKSHNLAHKGFTLLEIVIAMSILAVMMVSITQLTGSILVKKDRNEIRMQLQHQITVAITKITDDLHMAFLADSKFQGKDQKYKTGFVGKEDGVNFSTMSQVHFVKNKADTEQVAVGYFLEKNEADTFVLKRRQTDRLPEKLDVGGQAFALLRDVSQFSLEYFDANKKEWQKQWDTESVSAGGQLPRRVKIKIAIMGESIDEEEQRKEYNFEFLVEIPMFATKINF